MMTLRHFLKLPFVAALLPASVLDLFGKQKQYISCCHFEDMVGVWIEFSRTRPAVEWETVEIVEHCPTPMMFEGRWVSNPWRNKYIGRPINRNNPDVVLCLEREGLKIDFSKLKEVKAYRLT